ncbi:hypothetical protein [Pseudobacteriovorax antillogorgiicola]|uniref:Alpha/beta hydrolase n=1 Tax=Pseudobacteriovorax antillogorgiicola TaxID=1513793 RepID=A0A1Y6CSX1_9BACT|nr:hypothetical protein [Pseudobacteriovorax antillogorgiicola]TCS45856.1 hypothetical protein EDD56_12619 [Pseudobacteriovorax antillogorgiicola]SMF71376.1 hypothetical protein SAMN06296036_12679 [Pseudobacteriovorax antillogorgiicola]
MKYIKEDLAFFKSLMKDSYSDVMSQVVGELDEFSEVLRLPPLRMMNSVRKYAGVDVPLVDSIIPRQALFADGDRILKVKKPVDFSRDDEMWVYINGVMVDINMLAIQGRWLSKLLGKEFLLLHNPTDGLFLDLFESFLGRNVGIDALPVRWMKTRLENLLDQYPDARLNIVAHSQGCIILGKCLHHIAQERPDQLDRIHIFTFASPSKSIPQVAFAEHYANSQDLVAQLGVLHPDVPYEGKIFQRAGRGHWFNTHYLASLMKGEFGDTELYRIMRRKNRHLRCVS